MSFAPVPDSHAGLPLEAVPAVALDTETTGLDPATDRVIEIGAVGLAGGRLDTDAPFAALVDPGLPIPPAATAIHGITDGDVAGAPDFAATIGRFTDWVGPTLVVGYAIGFDLAVLKAEHDRHGLTWRPPWSLDVGHLVQVLEPELAAASLERVAARFGLAISGRHRAVADAAAAGGIFLALIPRLRRRGIATLAQAERACFGLTVRLAEEARAGWHPVGRSPDRARARIAELARIDSFPYRHRVADLMTAPPLVIASDLRLRDALGRMLRHGVSSLFLAPDAGGQDHGIVTERDVMRALAELGGAALDQAAGRFGQRPLVTVAADELVYRALGAMAAKGFRHLGVAGAGGELVGALSVRDLLRQRADEAVRLGERLDRARTAAELGGVWSELTQVAGALVREDVAARQVAAVVSRELRALTRRAAELAERELAAAGQGPAPVPYAVLVLGSGGRGESLLAMDQDNALLWADGAPGGAANPWFAALGGRLAEILNQAGVAYCPGGVMASNPAWRSDLAGWRAAVRSWIGRSRPQDILNADIFFDAVAVHGDAGLAHGLRAEALALARGSRTFAKFLALNAGDFTVPVGWFGRLRLTGGRIDLKRGGLLAIISAARVVALAHGFGASATPERLRAARGLATVSDRTIDSLIAAHGILLDSILRQQLRDIDRGLALTNSVAPAELDGHEKQELKWALDQVPRVADLLGTPVVG